MIDGRYVCIDYFGGEGGAGKGYGDAGALVFAVDNDPKRLALNPNPSHLGDVIEVFATFLAGGAVDFTHKDGHVTWLTLDDVDFKHGSPTCTGYSQGTVALPDRLTRYDRLIAVTREAFIAMGKPYVIENVYGARNELVDPILLCGRMFGLTAVDDQGKDDKPGDTVVLDGHRMFESSVPLTQLVTDGCRGSKPYGHDKSLQVAGTYGGARRNKWDAKHNRKGGYVPKSVDVQRQLMGMPWASEKGCWLAIPPVFTKYVGEQIIDYLRLMASTELELTHV